MARHVKDLLSHMTLKEELPAFRNMDMEYAIEPGVCVTTAGQCSRERDLQEVILRVR